MGGDEKVLSVTNKQAVLHTVSSPRHSADPHHVSEAAAAGAAAATTAFSLSHLVVALCSLPICESLPLFFPLSSRLAGAVVAVAEVAQLAPAIR
jgi:hypothetical protein